MVNKYRLASILTIYINHSTRTEAADTIRMVYSMVALLYICPRATQRAKIKFRVHMVPGHRVTRAHGPRSPRAHGPRSLFFL